MINEPATKASFKIHHLTSNISKECAENPPHSYWEKSKRNEIINEKC